MCGGPDGLVMEFARLKSIEKRLFSWSARRKCYYIDFKVECNLVESNEAVIVLIKLFSRHSFDNIVE